MSTGNAIDCNMTIYLCRINSTKPDANIARCEVSEIVRYLHVDSCHFSVEWNETMNKTNSGTQMYLQFPMSDVFSRPKLFLLPTKVISTDPPEGSSRNHSSATTTTATSESNSKTQMTSPISTSPTITKQAICPSTTRPDYSETVPPVTGSEPPEVSTKEFVITNTSVCPTSACSWKSLIIAGISGAVVLAVVVISIFMYRRYYFRVPQVVHYEPTSCVELNENYFNAKEITHNVDHSSVSN
ncbi:uncharacterized protein LOC114527401 [Dendronephthya gigantea]|uniref:uncharacterized protein LOC114527401 n=1 Tax=Dendronephthya gigantea TaxID=151771 RepID=UPI00106B921E|nr:uncharacterized protein LOC114527401 [Dendronephthya gigantea]